MTPECTVHRCILSIGERNQDVKSIEGLYPESECKAFAFSFSNVSSTEAPKINVDSHIASACYVHSAEFLSELSLCAGDFRDYAASAAKSIQTAAADVAKEFVTATNDEDNLRTVSPIDSDNQLGVSVKRSSTSRKLSVVVYIGSPVIVLPRTFNSPDLLVGNLGQITVRNLQLSETDPSHSRTEQDNAATVDRIFLDISNVSLYSLTLNEIQVKELSAGKVTFDFLKQRVTGSSSQFSTPHRSSHRRPNLASLSEEITKDDASVLQTESHNTVKWIEILHETGFQLIIDRITHDRKALSDMPYLEGPRFKVEGKILRAVRVELSSNTYNQLLETLNSLSATGKQGSAVDDQSNVDQRLPQYSATSSNRYFLCVLLSLTFFIFSGAFFSSLF